MSKGFGRSCSRALAASGVALALLMGSCGWFEDAHVCETGTQSCSGSAIRVCVPDTAKVASAGVPEPTKWSSIADCEAGSAAGALAGPMTCAMRDGQAQCVVAEDGGEAAPPAPRELAAGRWLRVDAKPSGDSVVIQTVESVELAEAPLAAPSGVVAVVAYEGDRAVDARLLRGSSAWVWGEGVDRVKLVAPGGQVLDEKVLPSSPPSAAVGMVRSALYWDLPPTLGVASIRDGLEVPAAFRQTGESHVVDATREMRALAYEGLGRLTHTAASAVVEVVFVSHRHKDEDELDAGVAETADAGVAEEAEPGPRSYVESGRVWVDVTEERLERYRESEAERLQLTRELVERAGEAAAELASLVTQEVVTQRVLTTEVEVVVLTLPDDYPPEIGKLIKSRLSPLLADGEGFVEAWTALHDAAVVAGAGEPYGEVPAGYDDVQAVADGFGGVRGREGAEADVGALLAAVVVPEERAASVCDTVRDASLDALPARQLVTVTKLEVLQGMGLVSRKQFSGCAGKIGIAPLGVPGVVVHKSTGEVVTYSEEVRSMELPYFAGATHLTGTANRGEAAALVDIMYLGEPAPELFRIRTGTGLGVDAEGQRQGASLSFSTATSGEYSPARGGLLVLTRASRDAIEGYALSAVVGKGIWTANDILPLVRFRFDAPLFQEDAL